MNSHGSTNPLKTGLVGEESTGIQKALKETRRDLEEGTQNKLDFQPYYNRSPSLDGGLSHRKASPSPETTKKGRRKVVLRNSQQERLCLVYKTS